MKALVIYATAGAGHRKAAEAIAKELKASGITETVLVDSLAYTNRFYQHSYSQTYTFLITHAPWLWAIFFGMLDIPALLPLFQGLRRLFNTLNAWPLERYLRNEKFDYIFSTHFFPNEVAGYLKRSKKITATVVCSVTDFDVHRIWLARGIDYYTVATPWSKQKLISLGVAAEQIVVSGIPTDRKFSQPKDIVALKRRLGLRDDVFTVLVATGSFGIGPIEEILYSLNDFQVLVVCGHNQNLYQRLSQANKGLAKIFGLVDNMDELMAVSDVIVTKPGGLSISEALVCGLPMIFFNAIPGQETNNIRVLLEQGVGVSGLSIAEMVRMLQDLRASPEKIQAAKIKSKSLGRPSAVQDIVALAQRR
jgi:processive 1,2-diacylglycerol beta-glucosyltransferase